MVFHILSPIKLADSVVFKQPLPTVELIARCLRHDAVPAENAGTLLPFRIASRSTPVLDGAKYKSVD